MGWLGQAASAAVSAGVIMLKLYPSSSPSPHPVGKDQSVWLTGLKEKPVKIHDILPAELHVVL